MDPSNYIRSLHDRIWVNGDFQTEARSIRACQCRPRSLVLGDLQILVQQVQQVVDVWEYYQESLATSLIQPSGSSIQQQLVDIQR